MPPNRLAHGSAADQANRANSVRLSRQIPHTPPGFTPPACEFSCRVTRNTHRRMRVQTPASFVAMASHSLSMATTCSSQPRDPPRKASQAPRDSNDHSCWDGGTVAVVGMALAAAGAAVLPAVWRMLRAAVLRHASQPAPPQVPFQRLVPTPPCGRRGESSHYTVRWCAAPSPSSASGTRPCSRDEKGMCHTYQAFSYE